jgi:hypothetical protein
MRPIPIGARVDLPRSGADLGHPPPQCRRHPCPRARQSAEIAGAFAVPRGGLDVFDARRPQNVTLPVGEIRVLI